MPVLTRLRTVGPFLLALAGCSETPAPDNLVPAATARDETTGAQAPPEPALGRVGETDAGGPENRFIVCPGNPRCPPEGR